MDKFTVKWSNVSGIWMSTMLPLPSDLQLLIDSMYDDGYSAEYLVKYDDISEDDLGQSDLLLGWEKPGKRPADNGIFSIIDPDRDGVRNQLPWMNYSKAVFVPNEIDYKIRARHKFHPHNGRIGGTLQKQIEHFLPDSENDVNIGSGRQEISSTGRPGIRTTTENLDFLLPIPEFGSKNKPNFKISRKTLPTKLVRVKQIAQKPLINSYIIPQNPEIPVITPGPEIIAVTQQPANVNSGHSGGSSLFGLVDILKKKFKTEKKENITERKNTDNDNSHTLENLLAKLLQMRDKNEYNLRRTISEEEKKLQQIDESSDNNIHMQKIKAMSPIIYHTRISHPGHKASYIAHVGPLTLHQHNKYSKSFD